ncbi:MAG: acetyl-CoA carboxylase biotin carboxyl carrier protein [Saprospiraceae bacterium]|nr:acetyl-CoA carboxylase biotin carboxyl carrier protein [Saprospiraceae bacterium]
MTFKEIQELIKLVNRLDLTEFKMREGEFEISIRTKKYDKTKQIVTSAAAPVIPAVPAPAPVATPEQPAPASPPPAAAKPAPSGEDAESAKLVPIKSPIVGTFYRSPAPDKPVYVKVGDTIEVGAVVCIVEAMKLFNEIESEVAGKIVKVVVEDASPVEYDQVLFLVDPNG